MIRYRNMIKMSTESIPHDNYDELIASAKNIAKKELTGVKNSINHKNYKKGCVEMNYRNLRMGYDSNYFVRNLITVTIDLDRYKIPRIFNRRKIKDRYK